MEPNTNELQPVSPHPMQQPDGAQQQTYHHADTLPQINNSEYPKVEAGIRSPQVLEEGQQIYDDSDKENATVNEHRQPDHIGVPDGGRRAWLVVFGAFLNFTLAFGSYSN